MNRSLLLEIGLEEVPARFIRGAADQLKQLAEQWLKESRIAYEGVEIFATPRRLAVHVTEIPEKQADIYEEVKGPAKKIAVDDKGEWSKAALGFARSQGVEPEQLVFRELKGIEYVYAQGSSEGQYTFDVLRDGIEKLVLSMNFPKNMRWAAYDLKFVRPIRWIVALFGEELIPLEIAGVKTDRLTKGHRFLGTDASIASPEEYVSKLREQYVLVDIEERKQRIVEQIGEIARKNSWDISVKEDLLEEVLFLVEYPTALSGNFDPSFLEIPQEVLITSMREHQRYFPVMDQEGKLLPHFVTVRNGDDRSIETVAKGNEKVLRARLADARFFYLEDQKLSIDSALDKLESIVFHEELGSIGDKVRRIRSIADSFAEQLKLAEKDCSQIRRAATICKFDLVTQMVYEFPELQGVMGEDYAQKAGEPEQVAKAVNEHYQPRFSGDDVPSSIIGAVVSIADKMDTIAGCFSIGIVPTGSQDPYALRRQASGVVQILLEHELPFTLTQIFETAVSVLQKQRGLKRSEQEIFDDLTGFFSLRVKSLLSDRVRYDIVDATMAAGFDHIASTVRRADALKQFAASEQNKEVLESFNRVINLASKAESDDIRADLFQEGAEQALYEKWAAVHEQFSNALAAGKEEQALSALSLLREPIHTFFDSVMVMADDAKIRRNRLALLKQIAGDFESFADFQKLVWS